MNNKEIISEEFYSWGCTGGEEQVDTLTKHQGYIEILMDKAREDEVSKQRESKAESGSISGVRKSYSGSPVIPIRQWCSMCGHIHKIDYFVPEEIWKEAIHPHFQNSVVCLNCFMERADEKFLEWDKDIKLYPCSFFTQRQIQERAAANFS